MCVYGTKIKKDLPPFKRLYQPSKLSYQFSERRFRLSVRFCVEIYANEKYSTRNMGTALNLVLKKKIRRIFIFTWGRMGAKKRD